MYILKRNNQLVSKVPFAQREHAIAVRFMANTTLMERGNMKYKITNFDGSITFSSGNNRNVAVLTFDREVDSLLQQFNLPNISQWFVLWRYGVPVDFWFYGNDEPEQELPRWIESAVLEERNDE